MQEKAKETLHCYNLKIPDPQCQDCIWLEWDRQNGRCKNRQKIICNLYVDEVFGSLSTQTIN